MMKNQKIDLKELIFEERDTQIFRIPDIKARLSALQNYFFPRLDILLRHSLDTVSQVYDLNPYDKMGVVSSPSHREKAKENLDFGMVHIGVAAKRGKQPLKIFKTNGKPFFMHPTYLTFQVLPNGTIHVQLIPFRQAVDDDYVAAISGLIKKHSDILNSLLSSVHIRQRNAVVVEDQQKQMVLS